MKLFTILASVLCGVGNGLTISDKSTNNSSPLLQGLIFEDINRCGDGGLYGELLNNRAFQGVLDYKPSLDNYEGINEATDLELVNEPLSDALQYSMKVSEGGFVNRGYWGVKVKEGEKYTARFYLKEGGDVSNIKVSLRGMSSEEVFVSAKPVKSSGEPHLLPPKSNGFQLYSAELIPKKSAPDSNNAFCLEFDGSDAIFNFVSLMPTLYKGRKNGLRVDLAEAIEGMAPSFLRFPGGNNLEGQVVDTRWKWNETVGPLINRRGRMGDWTYPNTNGLGMHEYFEWCEDMRMTPILDVYAGYSLGGEEVKEEDLQPYVDEVMNQLEYCLGDGTTKYGKQRVENGRKEPFDVRYVEIGNEDFFSKHYDYRFPAYHKAIKEKYPDMVIIASSEIGIDFPKDEVMWWDQHYYKTPEWFIGNFSFYDNYPRNNTKILVSEYAGTDVSTTQRLPQVVPHSHLLAGIGEAVWMLGMERNSDKVLGACYAPLLQNVHATQTKAPGIIEFGASSVAFAPSYYVQKLYANAFGDKILQLQNPQFDPLYYLANLDSKRNRVHVKVANPTNQTVDFAASIDVQGFKDASTTGQAISSYDPNAKNFLDQAEAVSPKTLRHSYRDGELSFTVGPYFFGVVTLEK